DRLLVERADAIGGDADRDPGDDHRTERHAGRAEAERGPDQRREGQGGERRVAQGGHGGPNSGKGDGQKPLPGRHPAPRPPPGAGSAAQVRISGRTISAPAVSPRNHVRQNFGITVWSITPPAYIEIVPTVALIVVAAPTARSIPLTCAAVSREARGPISRRNSHAPTITSAMFPSCCPMMLPTGGCDASSSSCPFTSSSPRKIPGHHLRPKR